MSLSGIKDFLIIAMLKLIEVTGRTLSEINRRNRKMEHLKESISRKISHLNTFLNSEYLNQNDFKTSQERKALLWKKGLNSGMDVEYGYAELRTAFKRICTNLCREQIWNQKNAERVK